MARTLSSPNPAVSTFARVGLPLSLATLLSACVATAPTVGGGSASPTTGATAGAASVGENSGSRALPADARRAAHRRRRARRVVPRLGSRLGSTAPLLNLLIMQSNCFVVVERGSGEASIRAETIAPAVTRRARARHAARASRWSRTT